MRWDLSFCSRPKFYLFDVVLDIMMSDLLKIQNEMGLPHGQSHSLNADQELDYDEVADDHIEWLGVPTNYSPYHTGYTTNHWLMVFRAVEATV